MNKKISFYIEDKEVLLFHVIENGDELARVTSEGELIISKTIAEMQDIYNNMDMDNNLKFIVFLLLEILCLKNIIRNE